MEQDQEPHWYALKVFYNRVSAVENDLHDEGCLTYFAKKVEEKKVGNHLEYIEKPIVNSLLFVCCTESFLVDFKRTNDKTFLYYSDLGSGKPASIPPREMEIFKMVTSTKDPGLEYLGEDSPWFHEGDKVRVIDGIYKGAEGYIKRIKADRRLVVTVSGVAVVATSFIHPSFLVRI